MKSIRCVFTSYSEESKAYRLYDPVKRSLLISRDVVIDETASYYDQPTTVSVTPTPTPIVQHITFPSQSESVQSTVTSQSKGKSRLHDNVDITNHSKQIFQKVQMHNSEDLPSIRKNQKGGHTEQTLLLWQKL